MEGGGNHYIDVLREDMPTPRGTVTTQVRPLNNLEDGSFRNRENLQNLKTADSGLLYVFNGKCNTDHAQSVFCFPSEPNIPEGPEYKQKRGSYV